MLAGHPYQPVDRSGDRARFAFLRSSNMLWALGDPARAKELIDEASRITPPHARTYIDAFLTVYWFAMDQPDAAVQASKNLALEDIARRRSRDSLGTRPDIRGCGAHR